MAYKTGYMAVPTQLGHVATFNDTDSSMHQAPTETYYGPGVKPSKSAKAAGGTENPQADEKSLGPKIPTIPGKGLQWPGKPKIATDKFAGTSFTNNGVAADFEEGTCV